MADDMGWSDLGCYGGEIRTPHIDSLAEQGLRFTQFYNNAICGPTRASLLTGLYCQQTGHAGERWNEPKDFARCATIAELLNENGYHTMMVGKWQGRDLAVKRGFDRFFGPNCQAKISYFHEVPGNPFVLDEQPWKAPDGFYLTNAFNAYAVEFLEQAVKKDQPLFLYVAHIAPHWPLHAWEKDIAPYRDMYRKAGWGEHRRRRMERQRRMGLIPAHWKPAATTSDIPDWSDDPHKDWQAERMAVYAAQIDCIDRGVGQILDTLRKSGRFDNTLVMFLSDNGAARNGDVKPTKVGFGFRTGQEKWRLDAVPIRPGSGPENMPGAANTFAGYGHAWAHTSNAPFRSYKATAYEGGIRTPLVVQWPNVIRKNKGITNEVGHVIDIMATCLDIADADYPQDFHGRKLAPMEGRSLAPAFRGEDREDHEVLCWSPASGQAIRMGRWKLVRPKVKADWELYDLEADGGETTDLADSQPQRVKELAEEFQRWAKRVGIE
jgi:arylsulfatase